MKEGVPHTVPLTPEALVLLGERGDDGDLIFGRMHESAMRSFVEGGIARFTGSVRRSPIGRPSTAIRQSFDRWRSLIASVTKRSVPIDGRH